MTRTYVPRFLAAGGRLLPRTRVDTLRRGPRWEIRARHETSGELRISAGTVFVCGGAVQTPALLRRSGITARVGDSLRLHPTVKLTARFAEPVNAADMGVPVHQVKEFAPRLSFGGSISSPPYLALGLLDHPSALRTVPQHWSHLANYYAMITGEGSGTVRTVRGCRDPLVRYRLTERDRRDLADGLTKLAEVMFAAGATEVCPGLPGAPVLRSLDDVRALPSVFPAGAGLMTIHLFSSCPMGERHDRAVTDSFGRVHGQPSLHLADAGLLCGAPGVNPQGTIMALARRNALHFLGKL
jgi:choline dehydrogenase-like flavoprotein